jgi:hypothetical protein
MWYYLMVVMKNYASDLQSPRKFLHNENMAETSISLKMGWYKQVMVIVKFLHIYPQQLNIDRFYAIGYFLESKTPVCHSIGVLHTGLSFLVISPNPDFVVVRSSTIFPCIKFHWKNNFYWIKINVLLGSWLAFLVWNSACLLYEVSHLIRYLCLHSIAMRMI